MDLEYFNDTLAIHEKFLALFNCYIKKTGDCNFDLTKGTEIYCQKNGVEEIVGSITLETIKYANDKHKAATEYEFFKPGESVPTLHLVLDNGNVKCDFYNRLDVMCYFKGKIKYLSFSATITEWLSDISLPIDNGSIVSLSICKNKYDDPNRYYECLDLRVPTAHLHYKKQSKSFFTDSFIEEYTDREKNVIDRSDNPPMYLLESGNHKVAYGGLISDMLNDPINTWAIAYTKTYFDKCFGQGFFDGFVSQVYTIEDLENKYEFLKVKTRD